MLTPAGEHFALFYQGDVRWENQSRRNRNRQNFVVGSYFLTALQSRQNPAENFSKTTRLIEQAVQALGAGIGSAQNLLDVEAVILGGGLSDKLGPPFVERVESAMLPHVFAAGRSPKVLPSELGDLSGAVGAAVAAGG